MDRNKIDKVLAARQPQAGPAPQQAA